MKLKREYILLIIVILALSLYLVFRKTDKTHYQLPNVTEIPSKTITKLEIIKADSQLLLDKKDSKWFIMPNGYPADNNKVHGMLDIVQNLTLTALVSEAENYHPFDLSNDKKSTIKVWTGDTLALEFEMGRTAPSWNHTFVKLIGDSRVYHAKGNFKAKFDYTVAKLRDKTVLSFNRDEITEINLKKGEVSLVLVKKKIEVDTPDQTKINEESSSDSIQEDIVWEAPDGNQANSDAVDKMLSTLSNLKCEKYSDIEEKDKFINPIYTITLKGLEEYSLSLYKHDGEDQDYPAISSGNDFPFLLSASQGEKFLSSPQKTMEMESE